MNLPSVLSEARSKDCGVTLVTVALLRASRGERGDCGDRRRVKPRSYGPFFCYISLRPGQTASSLDAVPEIRTRHTTPSTLRRQSTRSLPGFLSSPITRRATPPLFVFLGRKPLGALSLPRAPPSSPKPPPGPPRRLRLRNTTFQFGRPFRPRPSETPRSTNGGDGRDTDGLPRPGRRRRRRRSASPILSLQSS